MSLSRPEPARSQTAIQLSLVLLLGAVLGGGIGFYLGRMGAAEPAPCPQAPETLEATPNSALSSASIQPARSSAPNAPAQADQRKIDSEISGSLYATLSQQLEGREADILSAQIGRLLVWWLDARRDVLRGDRVQVLYEPEDGPGQLRVLALRYLSTKQNTTFQAFRFQAPGARYGRYYDQTGQEVEQRLVAGPIDEYEQVTELMSLAGRSHRGVDFKTDVGTAVKSPFRAKVMRRNWKTRRNGNCLHLVYLDSGATAIFLHLDEILVAAKPGQVVPAGTEIARAGNTGRSTAPHLHYELHDRNGRLVNPFEFHQTHRIKLEGEGLKAFERHREQLTALLEPGYGAGTPAAASIGSGASE